MRKSIRTFAYCNDRNAKKTMEKFINDIGNMFISFSVDSGAYYVLYWTDEEFEVDQSISNKLQESHEQWLVKD